MTTVVSVPANEGISVKNEHNDPEIDAMALKMKETFQRNASQSLRQQGVAAAAANVYINRAGRPVPLAATAISSKDAPREGVLPSQSPKNSEDSESVKGRFGWIEIGSCYVPYILRIINEEKLKYVSVRMAETQLLSMYLNYLHPNIYTCTSVKSHFITEAEAKLFNEINQKHSDLVYGKELFQAGKDYIVRLEDVQEFYTFIEVCYKKLLSQVTPGGKESCGFIRINSESVVPYCIKEGKKYVPLFYFEGETENLKQSAVKLENWNLAYLKFCCKVQGIRNELFASDSCTVTSLDDIKNYFPPDTNFEEYWPAKVVDTQLLTNQKNAHINSPAAWIRAPPALLNTTSESILPPHSLPASSVVPPSSMPLTNNTYQNGWISNQMVNSYNIQAQPQPTRGYSATSRNQNVAAQYYNSGSGILQPNSASLNNVGHIPPPPLVRSGTTSASVVSSVPYSNNVAISQAATTMYNAMSTSSTMSHSNHVQQFYRAQTQLNSNNNQAPQQQQQSYVLSATQSQPAYNNQSMSVNGSNGGRVTNTQQRNALRTAASATNVPPSEIIDLSSPPSSPPPQPVAQDTIRTNGGWELKKIPERPWAHESPNNVAYKMQKATLQGKMIHCINAKPYRYSDLMVTLSDLVQTLLPSCSVSKCAHVLYKYLKTTLYCANSEQLTVLRDNGRLKSPYPDDTPMAMLQDITHVLLQLKNLVSKHDEQIQQYQAGGQSKRPRMS